jgi:hypothetical protein
MEQDENRRKKQKKTSSRQNESMMPSPRCRDSSAPLCKHACPRRQICSDRRSRHYYSLPHYAQTAHNGAMPAPTEHQVVLDFIRKKYRSQNQSRVLSPRCRDSGPHFSPKRTLRARSHRQPPSPTPARFARTRAPHVSWWTVYYCNTTPKTCSRKPCP